MNTAEMETTLAIVRADIARLKPLGEDIGPLVAEKERLKTALMKSNLLTFFDARKAKRAAVQQRVDENYIPVTTFTKEEFEEIYPPVDEEAAAIGNYPFIKQPSKPTPWQRAKPFLAWGFIALLIVTVGAVLVVRDVALEPGTQSWAQTPKN